MNFRLSPPRALMLLLFASLLAAQQESRIVEVQGGKIRVVPVASGLFHPWGLAFVDARTILVTERNGRLRIIRDGVLAPEPI